MRTVVIHWSGDERYENFRATRDQALQKALGYLVGYAMRTYNHLNLSIVIGRDVADMEITAFYQQKTTEFNQTLQFTIRAIWHEDRQEFSFHS